MTRISLTWFTASIDGRAGAAGVCWSLVAGVVGVDNPEQAQRVGPIKGGGVESRGGLPLTPGSLVAGSAVTRHLSQPGDEGALPVVEAVAGDRAGGALCGEENPPDRGLHWPCSLRRGCRGGGGGGGCGLAVLNLHLDSLLILSPGVESHTGVLTTVR